MHIIYSITPSFSSITHRQHMETPLSQHTLIKKHITQRIHFARVHKHKQNISQYHTRSLSHRALTPFSLSLSLTHTKHTWHSQSNHNSYEHPLTQQRKRAHYKQQIAETCKGQIESQWYQQPAKIETLSHSNIKLPNHITTKPHSVMKHSSNQTPKSNTQTKPPNQTLNQSPKVKSQSKPKHTFKRKWERRVKEKGKEIKRSWEQSCRAWKPISWKRSEK